MYERDDNQSPHSATYGSTDRDSISAAEAGDNTDGGGSTETSSARMQSGGSGSGTVSPELRSYMAYVARRAKDRDAGIDPGEFDFDAARLASRARVYAPNPVYSGSLASLLASIPPSALLASGSLARSSAPTYPNTRREVETLVRDEDTEISVYDAREGIKRLHELQYPRVNNSPSGVDNSPRWWGDRPDDAPLALRELVTNQLWEELQVIGAEPEMVTDQKKKQKKVQSWNCLSILYLRFTAIPDDRFTTERKKAMPFHQAAMALIKDNWALYRNEETGLRRFLEQFEQVIADAGGRITISPYEPGEHCTLVYMDQYSLPRKLWAMLQTEDKRLRTGDYDHLVNVRTGTKMRPSHIRERRNKIARTAREARKEHEVPEEVAELMGYLNDLPTRRFSTAFKGKRKGLYHMADELYEGRPNARLHAERAAFRAHLYKKPIYKTTPGTLRLSPAAPSLLTVCSDMRQYVLDDCVEIDMASAQLALVAALWDVGKLRAFLKDGRSWWDSMISHLQERLPNNVYKKRHFRFVKGMLKGNTYSTCFAMLQKNLRRFGNTNTMTSEELYEYRMNRAKLELLFRAPIEEIGKAFLSHPLIKELLEARDVQLSYIKERGYATDCWGRQIFVEPHQKGKEGRSARQVLASTVQNAEMFVMLGPAQKIMEAEGRNRPKFYLWQHDGFTFKVRERDIDTWTERLDDALQARCRELEDKLDMPNIHTRMEIKYDPRKLDN